MDTIVYSKNIKKCKRGSEIFKIRRVIPLDQFSEQDTKCSHYRLFVAKDQRQYVRLHCSQRCEHAECRERWANKWCIRLYDACVSGEMKFCRFSLWDDPSWTKHYRRMRDFLDTLTKWMERNEEWYDIVLFPHEKTNGKKHFDGLLRFSSIRCEKYFREKWKEFRGESRGTYSITEKKGKIEDLVRYVTKRFKQNEGKTLDYRVKKGVILRGKLSRNVQS